jgi:hypothetical protein
MTRSRPRCLTVAARAPAGVGAGGGGARAGPRDPAVVERAALDEPLDGAGDLVWRVSAIVQAGTHSLDRQLASREHPKTLGVGVGLIHRIW